MCLDFLVDMKLKPAPEHFLFESTAKIGVVWGPEKSPDLAKQVQTGMGMGQLSYEIWGHEHPLNIHLPAKLMWTEGCQGFDPYPDQYMFVLLFYSLQGVPQSTDQPGGVVRR